MLTIVIACYGQPEMMDHQFTTIYHYPISVLDKLTVIIVDDCGDPPQKVPIEVQAACNFKLIRVTQDVAWNQMGARNIGMREAEGWCVMLDPDMVIEPDMISKFMAKAEVMARGRVHKFALKRGDKPLDFSSPNTWLIHRDDFFKAGGYDEDFRGHKGWSDCLLQEFFRALFKVVDDKDLWVTFHLAGRVYSDAQVQIAAGVDRNHAYNKTLKVKKGNLIKKMGGHKRYLDRKLNGPKFRCKTKRII